jgi:hypothetical protein
MKPIAAPIIGGMVASIVHVLIITPVIFIPDEDAGLASWHTPRLRNASLSRAIIQNALENVLTRRIRSASGRVSLRWRCGWTVSRRNFGIATLDPDCDGVGLNGVSSKRRELLPTTRPPPSPFGSS